MSEPHPDISRIAADTWDDPDDITQTHEPNTYVTFELAGQIFAVDVGNVREILDLQPISRLPNAPSDLLGMIDVRGQGIAVVDLLSQLGLSNVSSDTDCRILVLEIGAAGRKPVGVIADRVLSVVSIADSDIEPPPEATMPWRACAMIGITRVEGELVTMLALERLFKNTADQHLEFM